ncbi:DUF202 domain-containing protein [Variovorax sp. RA8]|uniref:DUF202 domain-containing protein n=1 Tax=Variovorax sp. (strain JCM 16519 / RA8) TaxID=662548 RepID=UPI0013A57859|nr:DUF202 domain-containing protein [Variovorax sp. RA8]
MHRARGAYHGLDHRVLIVRAPPPRDPGLQPERTTLSWTGTASGLLLNGVLNLRAGYVSESAPIVSLSCHACC